MLPVRCFTCNYVVGDKWRAYMDLKSKGVAPKECLDNIGLKYMCCRRMLLSHVSVVDDLLCFSNIDKNLDDCNTVFNCEVKIERCMLCK